MSPVVLVADDSRVIRILVRQQLVEDGYAVAEAENGRQAIDSLRETPADVVLLDVEMPVLGGFDTLKELKRDPELSDIPVVFLTARDSAEDVVAALDLGAHDYLRKPFEPAELIARVRAAVRMKALQDELRERNEVLEKVSRTDVLTGLWNRRHLEEHLDEVASAARRRGSPYSVLMIDIDHFKRVNDQNGHAVGDTVLREVATRLRSGIRTEDQVARWGGEEFLAVLPSTSQDDARRVAERLRGSIEDAPVSAGGLTVSMTVSIGLAAGIRDPEQLIESADRSLYSAKEAGRNRVVAEAEPAAAAG